MGQIENSLIEGLSRSDRKGLLARCEVVQLRRGAVLNRGGDRLRHVYFPLEGCISIGALLGPTAAIEIGMVGAEGMLGAQIALGVATEPFQAVVDAPGAARRADLQGFQRELRRRPGLKAELLRYIHVTRTQMAGAAACCGLHALSHRLARRLLMVQDRVGADSFTLTQERLARLLGVRRGGISAAAALLKRRGLINYHRGDITVIDRRGLEAAACQCYSADRRVYAAHLQ